MAQGSTAEATQNLYGQLSSKDMGAKCELRLKQKARCIDWHLRPGGNLDALEKDMLLTNKSSLGLGTYKFVP